MKHLLGLETAFTEMRAQATLGGTSLPRSGPRRETPFPVNRTRISQVLNQSNLRATIGSTRVARRAGT
jgi:hypothetical protein